MTQNQNSEFDIVTLIELAKKNKYERAVAGFQILDRIERLELPKKIKGRKLAVQAMFALANEEVQYKYVTKEERAAIEQENAQAGGATYSQFNGLFEAPQAPIAEEDMEEDFIPEEAAKPLMDMEDGEEGESYDDEEEDSDDEEEEDDDLDEDEEDDSDEEEDED
ncbi:DNA primase [Leptospira langatensis]|uniref:DNA primase n=1 Tax=Leptospira langatensis TaxID=2484983 RepID=UPI001AEF8732|nr:DNA primase [Leptospira langatensis]